jgi:hypothetical protein
VDVVYVLSFSPSYTHFSLFIELGAHVHQCYHKSRRLNTLIQFKGEHLLLYFWQLLLDLDHLWTVIWYCKLGFTNNSLILSKSTWFICWMDDWVFSLFFLEICWFISISICPNESEILFPSNSISFLFTEDNSFRQASFAYLASFLLCSRFVSQTFRAISPFTCSKCVKGVRPGILSFFLHMIKSWNLDLDAQASFSLK